MTTIAFFGATGGCINACLAYTLLNGYHARALVRTPSKLTKLLLSQPGITPEMLSDQLEIISGDATDVESVKETLVTNTDPNDLKLVTSIISGVGGAAIMSYTRESSCSNFKFRVPALPHIELENPHITEQTTRALLMALKQIATSFPSKDAYHAIAPRVTVISTTGHLPGNKDVGFWFRPMYSVLLPIPHADKLQMERLLDQEAGMGVNGILTGGLVVVRPSFLTGDHLISVHEGEKGGRGVGVEGVRVGTETNPAIGYTISRALVGEWIYEQIVKNGADWVGEKVTITS
ncbi:unnamed protein product [Penicillium salamii]|uniref:NAD(P)-binding domain-containing protein n=1 Tax=Penicillium salamii TaxID=1612424 RepID=A0A9W4NPA7_9EURO|nr:unnamed protein product [Penicillium salamii]CAG8333613.1 unnamed protein product [Penicillium salamii]CAG8341097.1 unnamed protein product [Penicillium salamii]CAG8382228.1 unnamed protein product [Penicillium salamii]CAG8388218.1 unnamed protein product [Penicillium salamii]